ncbi:PEP-CTERM sorting domain-containing protein [Thalassomonas haliotis]|uniref:PEP-CTERM sorting domain-containing protein n=1 Tax=Thalassomonas haliotis TaxID=485448 RepID=A0ABY7V6J7_9GAMM|nr:PEP-CTERM sorting domain-containing protein [Thalassomonas haliotis]WDE09363.1 PEP-CTERM sorting domain-containing protein [Thalassomonas haliotis]
MMKIREFLAVAFVLFVNANAYGGIINNGDFQSCDFQHWQKDTDGGGDPGATGDFSINNNAGDCSAAISVDLLEGASAFSANTLFTALDLTVASGDLRLSFDWDFSGRDDGSLFADNFFVSLGNGTGNLFNANGEHGHLIEATSSYGSGSFSVLLDSSFYNQSDWTLDFSVQGGWNANSSLSSTLNINNVSLTSVMASVPEPGTLIILLIAITGLMTQQRINAIRG